MSGKTPRLACAVREPLVSKSFCAEITAALLELAQGIAVESDMASNGVIYSDGIKADALEFDAGAVAHVRTAAGTARLVVHR